MTKIKNRNVDIKTCKGTGWITLNDAEQSNRFRMAWAAVFPNKIRLSLLSAGHPVETVVADGRKVSFISHTGSHPRHQINSSNPSLSKLLSIPVTVQEIIAIFSGRIPLRDHEKVQLVEVTYGVRPNIESGSRKLVTDYMLLLKQQNNTVEKIVLNPVGTILSYSFLEQSFVGNKKDTSYTVFHHKFKRVKAFLLPVKMSISDRKNRSIDVTISNYFPNASINPNAFGLTDSR